MVGCDTLYCLKLSKQLLDPELHYLFLVFSIDRATHTTAKHSTALVLSQAFCTQAKASPGDLNTSPGKMIPVMLIVNVARRVGTPLAKKAYGKCKGKPEVKDGSEHVQQRSKLTKAGRQ